MSLIFYDNAFCITYDAETAAKFLAYEEKRKICALKKTRNRVAFQQNCKNWRKPR